jgi:hypothetical protein
VALSGTLDTFALPDVLRLLASTAKTGRLRITGDRGSGSVWVDSGDVVATELANAVTQEPTHAEVVFGLLRFSVGSFTFETDAPAPNATSPSGMDALLGVAENMLVEWRAIEEVIPSLDVWVGLRSSLDGPDVMVDQPRWRGIAAVGSGAQVGAVAADLDLNEIDSCRLVKELLELGLVEFIDEPAMAAAAASFEPTPVDEAPVIEAPAPVMVEEPAPFEPILFDEPVDEGIGVFADETPGEPEALLHELDAMVGAPSFADPDDATVTDFRGGNESSTEPSLAALPSRDDAIEPSEDIFAGVPAASDDDYELDPAEMARQLANLSPKAAKAVAAAAKATTDVERDAALAAVEAEDDSVNRGLLLKFLGSVDS